MRRDARDDGCSEVERPSVAQIIRGGEKARDRREHADPDRRVARVAPCRSTEAESDKRRVRVLYNLEALAVQQIISCDKTDEGCKGRELGLSVLRNEQRAWKYGRVRAGWEQSLRDILEKTQIRFGTGVLTATTKTKQQWWQSVEKSSFAGMLRLGIRTPVDRKCIARNRIV